MKRFLTLVTVTAALVAGTALPASAAVHQVDTANDWLATTCKIGSARNETGIVTYKGSRCVVEPLDIDEIASKGLRYRDASSVQHTLHATARIKKFLTAHSHVCATVNKTGCRTTSLFTHRPAVVFRDGMTVDLIRF